MRSQGLSNSAARGALRIVAPNSLQLADMLNERPETSCDQSPPSLPAAIITPNTSNEDPERVLLETKFRRGTVKKRRVFGNREQRGCLHKRGKDPRWYVTVSDDGTDDDGQTRRVRQHIRLGRVSEMSEEAARQKVAEIVSRLDTKAVPSGRMTVHEFVTRHFFPDVVDHLKYAGREHYNWLMNRHILPAIGDMRMSEVTLVHLQKLCNLKLQSGLSVQTAAHIRAGLSAIFSRASALRMIEGVNPASEVRLPEMVRKLAPPRP